MGIVLNEHEWAECAIQSKSLGRKPSETLRRIARYYMDKGYSKLETRELLDKFMLQCDSSVSLPKWANSLDYAVNKAAKYEAIEIEAINITKSEMECIDKISSKQARRLAFTLLCLSKYWRYVIPENDYWVNNKDNEVMAMANINTSIKRQCAMYGKLKDMGMIKFSKKVDNTNVKVCFVDEDETDVVLQITDFRNIGYQYLKYKGEPYFQCQCCGITTKLKEPGKGRRQKYCHECAVAINTQQRVNSVMRRRSAKIACC